MNDNFEKIGFIGLGSMGKHMAKIYFLIHFLWLSMIKTNRC